MKLLIITLLTSPQKCGLVHLKNVSSLQCPSDRYSSRSMVYCCSTAEAKGNSSLKTHNLRRRYFPYVAQQEIYNSCPTLVLNKQQTIKIKSRFVLGFDDNFAVAEQCSSWLQVKLLKRCETLFKKLLASIVKYLIILNNKIETRKSLTANIYQQERLTWCRIMNSKVKVRRITCTAMATACSSHQSINISSLSLEAV